MPDIVPKRPTKREIGEALGVLQDERASLRAWSERNSDSQDEYFTKLAGRRARKAERLEKVIAWIKSM